VESILRNEKYYGDVLYQKTFSKNHLSHKTVKNKDVLPQWFWENNHPAIIKRENWTKTQELLLRMLVKNLLRFRKSLLPHYFRCSLYFWVSAWRESVKICLFSKSL